jgi:antitoxin HicB
MNQFEYAVKITARDEGGWIVTCRDLPELITQGDDLPHALVEATDAMDEVFAAYMKAGLIFPTPSKARRSKHMISPPADTVAKAALYVAMKEAGISNVELANRLGVDEKAVRRLLDPHYGSKLPRIAQAIAALDRRLVIGLQAV